MLSIFAPLQTLGSQLKNRMKDETGATAVEYGIMVSLIAIVIIVAVTAIGGGLTETFEEVQCAVTGGTWTAGTSTAAGSCAP